MEEPEEAFSGEGEEEEPFEFPAVDDPNPYNQRSYAEKGGMVIEDRPSDVERAIKNGELIDGMIGNDCGDVPRKYNMDYINAKSLLLQASSTTGENMYDHLTRIVERVLETQPPDTVDIVEDLSRQLKYERFSGRYLERHVQDLKIDDEDPNLDVRDPSKTVELAYLQQPLLLGGLGEGDADDLDPELETLPMPNFLELAFYMHQASTAFSTDELFRIGLSVKKLIATEPLQKVRLWGKILGFEKNYIVIEGDWQEGEGDIEEEPEDGEEPEDYLAAEFAADAAAGMGEGGEDAEDDIPLPVSKWKPPPIIPKEINAGVNKCAYYVTTEIGAPWLRLPMVTPEQIFASRKIRKRFTGDLEKPIVTYPPFPGPNQMKKSVPGLEKHYLRCQIARISAGTHVSPAGYFNFGGEEDEAEDGGAGGDPMENVNFQGIPVIELVDPSMENWVHHVPYVLPQGRISWFDPNPAAEEEGEGGAGDDFGMGIYAVPAEPEIGPPLLSTIAEDEPYEDDPAWTATLSSNTIPQYGVAILRNNRWPGAVTLSTGKKFFNIYVGNGLKYLKGEFQPELPPLPMVEYAVGPEITETIDPTPEEEEALRKLLMKGQGEGEGGEGGEDDEDEDENED